MHIINVELAPAIEDKLHSIHCDLEDVLWNIDLPVSDVDRVERFRLTSRFFDDALEFSVCSFYVVFIFS